MINSDERRILELETFIKKQKGNETYELKELIWTKTPFIIGYECVSMMETEKDQRSMFDLVSKISMLQTVTMAEKTGEIVPFKFKDNVTALNENKQKFKYENSSSEDMFLSELAGYIDLPDESLKALIFNEFKQKKITNELPVFHIVPLPFAAMRLNTNQKFRDGNDTMDFLHASFALPYCDFFFTENKLHSIITQLKLDNIYNCRAESKPEKVLEILELIK